MNSSLFITSPLISLVLLLMSSGSKWHCEPFNLWLIHTHAHTRICTHITQQNISSNYWFSINNCPRHCARQKILSAIRLPCFVRDQIDRMCMQSFWIQADFALTGCLMRFEVIVLELPRLSCHGLVGWWSVIDLRKKLKSEWDAIYVHHLIPEIKDVL